MRDSKRLRSGGFTLLELLMVVIIIAILASVAVPQFVNTAERARMSDVYPLLHPIAEAEQVWKTLDGGGVYTTDLSGATPLDVKIPQDGPGGPGTADWDITVTGTATGADINATRTTGTNKSGIIAMDIDTGRMCSDTAIWQVGRIAKMAVAGDC